jgi:hypothetical protein
MKWCNSGTAENPKFECTQAEIDKCKAVPEFGSDSTAYYLTIIGIVAVVAVAFIAMRKK